MTQQRYHGLDFVRAIAMLLGIILHITIFFVPAGTYVYWGVGEYNGDPINLILTELVHLFRMQLFFMMAGFFAELVIEHKGLKHLVKDRIKRIFVPFVVGVLILLPVHSLLINLIGTFSDYHSWYGDYLVGMSVLEQVTAVAFFGMFGGETFQNDGLMHLWFIYYLLIIYALHLVLRITCKPLLDYLVKSFGMVFCFAVDRKYRILLLGLISFPFQYSLTSVFFWPTGLNAPPNHLAFYFMFYIAGVVLYQNRYLLEKLASYGWFYLMFSIPFAVYIYEPSQRLDDSASIIRDITHWSVFDLSEGRFTGWQLRSEGIFHNEWSKVVVVFIRAQLCWAMCLAFIGLAHKYLNRPSPIVRYLADSAYWVYWIHLPITFSISKYFQQMGYVNSLIRSYLVLAISVVLIYWSYNTFVRYTLLGDYFMGRRKDKTQPGEESFSMALMAKRLLVPVTTIAVFVALLGMVLEFNNSFRNKGLLVEAYAARKESFLTSVTTIDGVADRYGNTPLHNAVRRSERGRRYETLPLLLEKTKRYNDPNDYGRTALFTAVRMGNKADVVKLVEAGANLNIPDKYGHTPAHVAAVKTGLTNRKKSEHFFSILQLLVQHGADLQLKDYKGRTVADCLQ